FMAAALPGLKASTRPSTFSSEALEDKYEAQRREIAQLKKELEDSKAQVDKLRADKAFAVHEKEKLQADLEKAQEANMYEVDIGIVEGRKSFLRTGIGAAFVREYRKEVVKAFCNSPEFLDKLCPAAVQYFDYAFDAWEAAVAGSEFAGKLDREALKRTLPDPDGYEGDPSLPDDYPWWTGLEAKVVREAKLTYQLDAPLPSPVQPVGPSD
ncbi:Unknown protein, partial [Striga hermonthica]